MANSTGYKPRPSSPGNATGYKPRPDGVGGLPRGGAFSPMLRVTQVAIQKHAALAQKAHMDTQKAASTMNDAHIKAAALAHNQAAQAASKMATAHMAAAQGLQRKL